MRNSILTLSLLLQRLDCLGQFSYPLSRSSLDFFSSLSSVIEIVHYAVICLLQFLDVLASGRPVVRGVNRVLFRLLGRNLELYSNEQMDAVSNNIGPYFIAGCCIAG